MRARASRLAENCCLSFDPRVRARPGLQTTAVFPLMYVKEMKLKIKKNNRGKQQKKRGVRTKGETAVVCKPGYIYGMCEYADARYTWAPLNKWRTGVGFWFLGPTQKQPKPKQYNQVSCFLVLWFNSICGFFYVYMDVRMLRKHVSQKNWVSQASGERSANVQQGADARRRQLQRPAFGAPLPAQSTWCWHTRNLAKFCRCSHDPACRRRHWTRVRANLHAAAVLPLAADGLLWMVGPGRIVVRRHTCQFRRPMPWTCT